PVESTGKPSFHLLFPLGAVLSTMRYFVRKLPITSKLSNAKPYGSNLAWHAAHDPFPLWSASCSRSVFAPRVSGSTGSMFAGGGGIGVPSNRSATHTPRLTGDVSVPFAVTFIVEACVQM